MDDEKAKVILCSRGGYGAVHLVGQLDFSPGFASIPNGLSASATSPPCTTCFQQNGFASLHAPMARHLTVEPEDDFCCQALKDILFGNKLQGRNLVQLYLPGTQAQPQRRGTGILRGGNLAVLYGLRGTPYDIPAEGTVLFIEDIGERPHAVERKMYNLNWAAYSKGCPTDYRTVYRIRREYVFRQRTVRRIGRFGKKNTIILYASDFRWDTLR